MQTLKQLNNLVRITENIDVKSIKFYKKSSKAKIQIELYELIHIKKIYIIRDEIKKNIEPLNTQIDFSFNINLKKEEIIEKFFDSLVYLLNKKIAITKGLLNNCTYEYGDNNLKIIIENNDVVGLVEKKCRKIAEDIFKKYFSMSIRVIFKSSNKDEDTSEKYLVFKKEQERIAESRVKESIKNGKENKEKDSRGRNKGEKEGKVILGKNIPVDAEKIINVTPDSGNVVIKGKVLNTEFKEIKGGRFICSFDVTDLTSTVTCKLFFKKDDIDFIKIRIKKGTYLKVSGKAQYNSFSRDLEIICKDIIEEEEVIKKDNCDKKRVELHLHTKMSSMDSVVNVEEVIKRAAFWGHKAIAVTDHGILQAYPEAYKAAKKENIKLILGVECYLVDDSKKENLKEQEGYHAIILVKNYTGLKNLYRLVSDSHLKYFYKKPRMPKSLIEKHREGLLLGSACEAGELYRAIVNKKSDQEIENIVSFYDYLEIQPLGNNEFMLLNQMVSGISELKEINIKIIGLGKKNNKPVIATSDVHFLDPEDEIFRKILMAGQGYKDADRQAPLYFRTTGEMLDEFNYLDENEAYEVVVNATTKIADLIEDIKPIPDGTFPPVIEGAEEEIRKTAEEKAAEIYGDALPQVVRQRLDKELNAIITHGFSVMYIIARKLVKKSNEDGYLVGSRGSVGSSFAAYLTEITEVNSLPAHYVCKKCRNSEFAEPGAVECGFDLPDKKCPVCGSMYKKDGYDIPFETFLGFDGDKEPDIDLNFSGDYQMTAHKYTEELFGREHVFRAGTIATIAEKTAFGFVNGYLEERKLIVTKAETNRLIKGCAGVKRTTGQHPGGQMIVPKNKDIYDFCPVQHPADDNKTNTVTTHFDYNALHGCLLKLDILGHDDPTIIKMLEDLTGVDARDIDLGEKKTMGLFTGTGPLGVEPDDIESEIGTFAVPEFGTNFVRQMLIDTKPTTFSELIRISGLSHGTDVWTNNAQNIVKSKTAKLSEVICTRDDIMLYLIQNGILPLTAFKIMEDVRKGKGLLLEYEKEMKEKGIPGWYIDSCKKIKYMFPKAHAAAYVMMAFRIAWFKVYYPKAFYAAYFTVRADEFDADIMTRGKERVVLEINQLKKKGKEATQKEKNALTILEVVNEMYARDIEFLPVDIYKSDAKSFLIKNDGILPPLNAIQGLGLSAAKNIEKARKNREFTSVEHFKAETGVSKAVIEVLKQNGCLSHLAESSQLSIFI